MDPEYPFVDHVDPFADADDPFAGEEVEPSLAAPGPTQEDIRVRVNVLDQERFPDLHNVKSVVLKDSKLIRREAKYVTVLDRATGELHHSALTIKTQKKRQGRVEHKPEGTVTLSTEGEDEVEKLYTFLRSIRDGSVPTRDGSYLVLPTAAAQSEMETLQFLVNNLTSPESVDGLATVLARAGKNPALLNALLERAGREPQLFDEAAAALKFTVYKRTLDRLQAMIDAVRGVPEAHFQMLLEEHPWMFGSEYSALLDRRHWTRDEQRDFVVRRTTDGYIELIEIKTPLGGADLFNFDRSHQTYYPGAELSKVVGQVMNYIERLDAKRDSIRADDGEDTCKIRAKVIIGRDGDQHQRAALRRFNGHLHRVEVLTFDQLLRIAERVVGYLEALVRPAD